IRIGADGRITLIMSQVEMGQGTYTSMPMLLAEELEVGLEQVRLEHAPPNDKLYANPLFGDQETGASTSVRVFYEPLRRAGATARTMLVAAAAATWNVDPGRGRVDGRGQPIAWMHRLAGPAILARYLPAAFRNGIDADGLDGAVHLLYDIPAIQVEFVRHEEPVLNTGFWRGVGVTHNTFVIESFIDELAAAAKQDPFEYRRALLGKSPRAAAVLELAAQHAGWGAPLPAGRARGIALMYSGWQTYLAQVAEVAVSASGEVRVHRIVCAADCGTVVNPDIG